MKKFIAVIFLGVATVSFSNISTDASAQSVKKKIKIIKKSKTSGLRGHSKFGKSTLLKKKLGRFDDKYYKEQYLKYGNQYYKYDKYDKYKSFSGRSKFGGRRSFGSSKLGSGRLGGFTGFNGSRRSGADRRSGRR